MQNRPDRHGDCTFVDQVCDVDISRDGKYLTITFPDQSRLKVWATFRTADGDYMEDCIDDVAITDGDWITAADKEGDVDLGIPLQSCDAK
jgi:hypothetical protein